MHLTSIRAAAFVTLPADEAHHLTRVLRLGAGDEVAVFDGRGRECERASWTWRFARP